MKESIEARIGRYLAGEMDEQEKAGFQNELATNPALEAAYLGYQRIWQMKPNAPADQWDQELAWVNFEKKNFAAPLPLKAKRSVAYWAIAASIVILSGATFYFLTLPTAKTYLYADAGSSAIELPDGSRVHLNKGSGIVVFPFTRKGRHVELSGEAFFEVNSDTQRPFTIDCGHTITEVVGTSFDLRQVKDEVLLFVNSGKVIFRSGDNSQTALALTAGEAAYFENDKLKMVANPSPNTLAWKTKELQLKDLSLPDAIRDVSSYFGVIITVENKDLNACGKIHSTLPFKDPQVRTILDVIARSFNALVVEKDGKYTIKGGSCN
ncbi:MAG TPA: FecR domain-containing protein [Saprospiraceae bacterium]|nr:FecR domain-containing protein [Saprospiraceae bacterium]